MDQKKIILILVIISIILAIALVMEVLVLNNQSTELENATNTTLINTTVESISNDSQESGASDTNSIDANRPTNDPNYKGYTPYHESEVTSDGWNPREHETYRETMGDGSQKIHYDDGYFRIVDKNGYVITYGYGE